MVTTFRRKLVLGGLGGALLLFAVDTAHEALRTLRQLDTIEAERDRWQRTSDIIQGLDLKPGGTVVDLGSGSGYFTLKLAGVVGPSGSVQAVDIRRLPLLFLSMRAMQREWRNIHTIVSQPDDPGIPSDTADAVLIVNTYHEFTAKGAILDRVFLALHPAGRLVIADPALTERGGNPMDAVETDLHLHGFDIVYLDSRFLQQPRFGPWWFIVAERPPQ